MIKNLLYYCWISDIDNISNWTKWNIDILCKYIHIFTGHKIIYIGIDNKLTTNSIKKFEKFFNFADSDKTKLIFVKNNPHVRESEYFLPMLHDINNVAMEDSMTFFAHTKGTSHTHSEENDKFESVKKWMIAMYFFNLEFVNQTESSFLYDRNIFSGILQLQCRINQISAPWHYSGTFFWINNNELFQIDGWDFHYVHRHSTESYPGSKCPVDRANAVCNLKFDYNVNPYHISIWNRILTNSILNENQMNDFNQIQLLCT